MLGFITYLVPRAEMKMFFSDVHFLPDHNNIHPHDNVLVTYQNRVYHVGWPAGLVFEMNETISKGKIGLPLTSDSQQPLSPCFVLELEQAVFVVDQTVQAWCGVHVYWYTMYSITEVGKGGELHNTAL